MTAAHCYHFHWRILVSQHELHEQRQEIILTQLFLYLIYGSKDDRITSSKDNLLDKSGLTTKTLIFTPTFKIYLYNFCYINILDFQIIYYVCLPVVVCQHFLFTLWGNSFPQRLLHFGLCAFLFDLKVKGRAQMYSLCTFWWLWRSV